MPCEDRDADVDVEDKPREKPRRSKSERKPDRERSDRSERGERGERGEREHRHHRSSKSTRSKLSEGGSETHSHVSSRHRHRRDKDESKDRDRTMSASDLLSDLAKSSLEGRSRVSFPYPSFSKAHSKEAVVSREELGLGKRSDPLTPEPTDLGGGGGGGDDRRSKASSADRKSSTSASKSKDRPPTPPDTDVSAKKKTSEERLKDEDKLERPRSRASGVSRSASRNDDGSKVSRKSGTSSQATFVKMPSHRTEERLRSDSRASLKRSSSNRSRRDPEPLEVESSPSSAQDSSPKTPTQTPQFPPHMYATAASGSALDGSELNIPSKTATPASAAPFSAPPPPPPPPPPALDVQEVPRVDYLLQNGGLAYPIPKNFLSVLPRQNGTRPSNPPLAGADTLFAPFFNLLDQYSTVINKHGSVAVATGHRSVARRLLDRLENVFSRDLPPRGCSCVMCERSHEIHRGLTWGDVLEWVCGRLELPQWPPFDLAEIGSKAAEISAEEPQRPASPIKMDPDIAEEFREHYLRQSKKVRSAVDKWLSSTGETPVPPPQEVDDETLTFAILTNLDPEDRPFFNALMTGSKELRPSTRAPTPVYRPRNDMLIKTGLSLQRLYRLGQTPRDSECAMYLIKNPHTHDLLVTMSDINDSEWEILISGRFDGFLWSGAEIDEPSGGLESRGATPASGVYPSRSMMSPGPRGPSAMGSRNATPFSAYSRGPTPASFVSLASSTSPGSRQPVSNDEEMEMAAIAEIEREIYSGMEALEDAFEKLHLKAEVVRTALRQRGAGLMQNLQNRRRIDVLPNPPSGNSQSSGYERPGWAVGSECDASDSEWGMDDMDIMPDDSASNISSSRHRRPKRRTERRTPAPIEEDDEE
ncbi:hypothetical protein B0I35DRAFT_453760 [Stachybotrys elegans]|uniref:5-Methylcytosine G/T mismatch-specific DNA glycosylase n=1 Tax=Stachybotrys elegans TaxID=80388 RepID=A0A8K0SG82_9HYPO|nr:hypothetical protein B0I35DRAFT_453760 [Stachybotrys elegans]